MFSWGAGSLGQLGSGMQSDSLRPLEVQACFSPVQQISCGGHHTVFLTGKHAHACGGLNGMGSMAEAGHEEQVVPQAVPFNAWSKIQVMQIGTGWAHAAFVTETGQAYMAGEGKAGQLGLGQSVLTAHQPCLHADLASHWEVKQAACGMHHTLLLAAPRFGMQAREHGQVILGYGLQKHGQLGLLPEVCQDRGKKARQITKKHGAHELVAAGGHLSAALYSSGSSCLVWGKDILTAAARGSYAEAVPLLLVSPGTSRSLPSRTAAAGHPSCRQNGAHFTAISLGWHHMLALDCMGGVWSWGSNSPSPREQRMRAS
ncbi:hypothetical protein WJX74_010462 [Apatococcus lobatus]|uniref:Secretion-regulating guanine nucleotide exchange factor n=1 Tax=Apatococcus lobatus TaxID=904363 RepID=A0AAW1QME8_9CHLO